MLNVFETSFKIFAFAVLCLFFCPMSSYWNLVREAKYPKVIQIYKHPSNVFCIRKNDLRGWI